MKLQANLLSALAFSSLTATAICDTYHTERCWCADAQRVGYVFTVEWDSDKYGHHGFSQSDLISRPFRKKDLLGQRCDNGSTTEHCINIPDPQKFDVWEGVYPAPVTAMCHTFDDAVELCGMYGAMRVDGRHFRDFKEKDIKSHTLTDCLATCGKYFARGDESVVDLCTYTNFQAGPMLGERIPVGMKVTKKGKLKSRGPFPVSCRTNVVHNVQAIELGSLKPGFRRRRYENSTAYYVC
jgi:hypothetical protein